jgi:hypothetical protein
VDEFVRKLVPISMLLNVNYNFGTLVGR